MTNFMWTLAKGNNNPEYVKPGSPSSDSLSSFLQEMKVKQCKDIGSSMFSLGSHPCLICKTVCAQMIAAQSNSPLREWEHNPCWARAKRLSCETAQDWLCNMFDVHTCTGLLDFFTFQCVPLFLFCCPSVWKLLIWHAMHLVWCGACLFVFFPGQNFIVKNSAQQWLLKELVRRMQNTWQE